VRRKRVVGVKDGYPRTARPPAFSAQTVSGISHSPFVMNTQSAPADWQQFTSVRLNC